MSATQLVVGGVALPRTSDNKYTAYESPLVKQVEMISGRIVEEVRGRVWQIEYEYDYMGNDQLRSLLTVLRAGGKIEVTFLPESSDTAITAYFIVTKQPTPTCAFELGGNLIWHDVKFSLREASPHD